MPRVETTGDFVEDSVKKFDSVSYISYNFGIRMNTGVNYIYTNQPCYGELRKYTETHGDDAAFDDVRPGDLYCPFPEGKPIEVLFTVLKSYETFLEIFKHEDNPWSKGLNPKDSEVHGTKKGFIVHLKNTDLDPTLMVSFFKNGAQLNKVKFGENLRESILTSNLFLGADEYSTTRYISPSRFLKADPFILSSDSFCNRGDYNRKELAYVWGSSIDYPCLFLDGGVQGMLEREFEHLEKNKDKEKAPRTNKWMKTNAA